MKIIWISLSVKSKMTKLSLWLEMNCEYMRNIHQGDTGKHKNCIEASQKKQTKKNLSFSQNQHDGTDGGSFFLLSPERSWELFSLPIERRSLLQQGRTRRGYKNIASPTLLFLRHYNPRKLQRDESHCVSVENIPIIPVGGDPKCVFVG